jgi:hypothetical protein
MEKGEKPVTLVISKNQKKIKQLARNVEQPYKTRSRGGTSHMSLWIGRGFWKTGNSSSLWISFVGVIILYHFILFTLWVRSSPPCTYILSLWIGRGFWKTGNSSSLWISFLGVIILYHFILFTLWVRSSSPCTYFFFYFYLYKYEILV